jgi:hypothetical protein
MAPAKLLTPSANLQLHFHSFSSDATSTSRHKPPCRHTCESSRQGSNEYVGSEHVRPVKPRGQIHTSRREPSTGVVAMSRDGPKGKMEQNPPFAQFKLQMIVDMICYR